ncbi:hypothetical protein DPMN_186868 [Dreissena polymorpha]|uniref:Uncharacterized protein n=1 Tax=Dreissena polymorpha TaxID=45954 RepID=A0A9D4DM97_DREPO|nr:hypothetical protein DPMN_186868 [Dreissena polymorpha]
MLYKAKSGYSQHPNTSSESGIFPNWQKHSPTTADSQFMPGLQQISPGGNEQSGPGQRHQKHRK